MTESQHEKNTDYVSRRRWWASECGGGAAGDGEGAKPGLGRGAGAVPGVDGPAGRVTKGDGDTDSGAVQHVAAKWVDAGEQTVIAGVAVDDPGFPWAAGEIAGTVLEGASGGFVAFRDSAFQPGDCGELGESLSGAAVRNGDYGLG